ncbi:hypothetical protein D7207_01645 [Burkholderia cepacia]|nr:hypothetical protein [Burkholderia cepacia]MBA9990689.1 hypothetical protein [Burkholderia cepacia]MBB0014554.1 hypothetical protein [Burkholderia cepacia]MBB0050784.1 hypothetical protein [Burkholderia cepacia]MBB0051235.1 hypothetical protein [Burkholderia cepacia]
MRGAHRLAIAGDQGIHFRLCRVRFGLLDLRGERRVRVEFLAGDRVERIERGRLLVCGSIGARVRHDDRLRISYFCHGQTLQNPVRVFARGGLAGSGELPGFAGISAAAGVAGEASSGSTNTRTCWRIRRSPRGFVICNLVPHAAHR